MKPVTFTPIQIVAFVIAVCFINAIVTQVAHALPVAWDIGILAVLVVVVFVVAII